MSTATKLAGKSSEMIAIEEVSRLVSEKTGIILGERQQNMVRSRLLRRMTELKITGYDEYLTYLSNHVEIETISLVSLLTTHHTYFFREFVHFEFLRNTALPALVAIARNRPDKTIRVWSAACSRGQEVYSLAMTMAETLNAIAPDIKFHILGSDVDPESVQFARNGVYPWDEVKEIPMSLLTQFWARGKGDISAFAKVKPALKAHCDFKVLNLVDLPQMEKFDLVFCRNVLIYFDHPSIKKIAKGLFDRLQPEGYLIVGVSESLIGQDIPIQHLGPSIYARTSVAAPAPAKTPQPVAAPVSAKAPSVAVTPAPKLQEPQIIRVLCVDDSPSILTILKKILSADKGFEIVATAKNGFEAAEALRKHKVDVMTLDIHMPGQTGIEYLQQNYKAGHIPVIMVTSVSREDNTLAHQALKLGASDYVEKPSLQNFAERASEIQNKIKSVLKAAKPAPAQADAFRFERKAVPISKDKHAMVVVLPESRLSDLDRLVPELKTAEELNVTVLIEGFKGDTQGLSRKLSGTRKLPIQVGSIENMSLALAPLAGKKTAFCFYRGLSPAIGSKFALWSNNWKIAEDGCQFKMRFDDVTPSTSFVYMALKYLSEDNK